MRLVLSAILVLLSCLIYGQKSSRTNISILPYYSFQKYVETGVDWEGRQFRRERHGWGAETKFNFVNKRLWYSIGVGYSVNYHRTDSLNISCGWGGCNRGYKITAYSYFDFSLSIGYEMTLTDKLSIIPGVIGKVASSLRLRSRSYLYPKLFYDDGGGANVIFRFNQAFVGLQAQINRSTKKGDVMFCFRYLHPLNRLDKHYDAFGQFNLGIGWVFNLKSGKNSQANTD